MEWYVSMIIGALIGSFLTAFIYNNMNTKKVQAFEARIAALEAAAKKI